MKCIVDEQFEEFISSLNMYYISKSEGYGLWKVSLPENKLKSLARVMYEAVFNMPIPENIYVDHIDRNTSNNRLYNLRLSTQKLNQLNRYSDIENQYRKYSRLDFGAIREGTRIRSPQIKNKTKQQIESISRYFYSLCRGSVLSPWSIEDKNEFMSIFKNEEHYSRWINTYGDRITTNLAKIELDYKIISEFSGYSFGTTFEQMWIDKLNKGKH